MTANNKTIRNMTYSIIQTKTFLSITFYFDLLFLLLLGNNSKYSFCFKSFYNFFLVSTEPLKEN